MNDGEVISFVERLDRCWMQGRLQDLDAFLAEDVIFVAPGGKGRSESRAQAVESYRQFTSHARIDRFQTSDYFVAQRGGTVIVEYSWQMTWVVADGEHSETGRDVLVLALRDGNWRVVWRTQIPTTGG